MSLSIRLIQFNKVNQIIDLTEKEILDNVTFKKNDNFISIDFGKIILDSKKKYWTVRIIFLSKEKNTFIHQPYLFKPMENKITSSQFHDFGNRIIKYSISQQHDLKLNIGIETNTLNRYFSNLNKEKIIPLKNYLKQYFSLGNIIS